MKKHALLNEFMNEIGWYDRKKNLLHSGCKTKTIKREARRFKKIGNICLENQGSLAGALKLAKLYLELGVR